MKRLMTLSILVLTVSFLASCSKSHKKEENLEANSVTINVTQELNTIDPSESVDSSSNIVLNNIYEGLYRLDEKNQLQPMGASELPVISEDGLNYQITLNDKAKWSNGDNVTAFDYVYAWRRSISSETAVQNNYLFTCLKNGEAILKHEKNANELGIEAIDEQHLSITLSQPVPYFGSMLAMPVFFPLNEKYIESQGKDFALSSENAIYNGPFVLSNFKGPGLGSNWTYLKNDNYWDKEVVKLDEIDVEVIKETTTSVTLFEKNKTDDINISGEFAKGKWQDESFVQSPTIQTVFLGYNQTKELYQNQKIRQAFSLIIDRENITENVLGNGASQSTGLVFEGLAIQPETGVDFSLEKDYDLKTDVDTAKSLWIEGKKEVGLTAEQKVEINLITFENEDMSKVAEYLQGVINDNFEGAKVNINNYPVSVFMENASKQQFDLYLVSWGADYSDPNAMLQLFKSSSASNWGKYNNAQYDDLLNQAEKNSLDVVKRWNNLLDAESILMETQGITPIYSLNPTYLRNPKLKNVGFHNVGPRFDYRVAELEK